MSGELEPRMLEVCRRYDDAVGDAPLPPDTKPTTPIDVDGRVVSRGTRFKVPLPKFDGNILNWWDFWQLFSAMLTKDRSLSEVEIICLLRDAIDDPTAQQYVDRAQGRHDEYNAVVNELKEEYDRCRVVYLKHAEKLSKRQTYDYTLKDMKSLVEHLENHLQGMKRCEGYTIEQYVGAQVDCRWGTR